MLDPKDIEKKSARLRRLLALKLGMRGKDLREALRRTGRLLPRRLRRAGAVLVKAETMAGNPKLARVIDGAAVEAAYAALDAHLRAVDVADARRGRMLSLLGSIAFNILAVAVGLVVFLWWRGFV